MPFSSRVPRGRKRYGTRVRVSERTVSLTSTSPTAACAQTRAAMLTAEPTGPSAVSAVSPAWTPIPTAIAGSAAAADSTMPIAPRMAALAEGNTT